MRSNDVGGASLKSSNLSIMIGKISSNLDLARNAVITSQNQSELGCILTIEACSSLSYHHQYQQYCERLTDTSLDWYHSSIPPLSKLHSKGDAVIPTKTRPCPSLPTSFLHLHQHHFIPSISSSLSPLRSSSQLHYHYRSYHHDNHHHLDQPLPLSGRFLNHLNNITPNDTSHLHHNHHHHHHQ